MTENDPVVDYDYDPEDDPFGGFSFFTTPGLNEVISLMASDWPDMDALVLNRLGTSDVFYWEFPVGQIDQVDLLLRWLS